MQRRRSQPFLSALLTGSTIWSTQFIAMLAFDPGVEHDYNPFLTAISLLVAIVGTLIARDIFATRKSFGWVLLAGVAFGTTVVTMHYVGMQAYVLPTHILWQLELRLLSIILGLGLGTATYHRIAFSVFAILLARWSNAHGVAYLFRPFDWYGVFFL